MKLLFGTIILTVTASAFAQDAPVAASKARVELRAAMGGDVIMAGARKNAPFTAEERGETVKVLADGNRIVDGWTGTIARNSEGRIRREITSGRPGAAPRPFILGGHMDHPTVVALGTPDHEKHVFIRKAAGEAGYTVAAPAAAGGEGVSVITTTENTDEAKRVIVRKMNGKPLPEGVRVAGSGEAFRVELPKHPGNDKIQSRKEDLGTRDFGGVEAKGVRLVTTFAPGAVGNEREIEVVSETWFSQELGVLVYSKRTDPRVGETTYQMTNINRAEPDASLFTNK